MFYLLRISIHITFIYVPIYISLPVTILFYGKILITEDKKHKNVQPIENRKLKIEN